MKLDLRKIRDEKGISDITNESFLDLNDTPSTFTSHALKFLRVNSGETSIEFFNLFGTANTWTGKQSFNGLVSIGSSNFSESSFNGGILQVITGSASSIHEWKLTGTATARLIIKSALRVEGFTSAGFIKNDASGNFSGGNSIDAGDITGSIDISDQTNLTASSPITLTDDDIGFDFSTNNTWTGTQDFNSLVTMGAELDLNANRLTIEDDGTVDRFIESAATNRIDLVIDRAVGLSTVRFSNPNDGIEISMENDTGAATPFRFGGGNSHFSTLPGGGKDLYYFENSGINNNGTIRIYGGGGSPFNPLLEYFSIQTFAATNSYTELDLSDTSGHFRFKKPIFLMSENEARFLDSNSSNYIGLKSPSTVNSNVTYELPEDGSNGQVIQTDGNGILSFTDQSGGIDNLTYTLRTSDQTISSTSATNDDTFSFSVDANTNYTFTIIYRIDMSDDDHVIDMTSPTSPTKFWYDVYWSEGGIGDVQEQIATSGSTDLINTVGGGQSGNRLCIIRGAILNGSNSGTVQLRHRKVTDIGGDATLHSGSWMQVKEY